MATPSVFLTEESPWTACTAHRVTKSWTRLKRLSMHAGTIRKTGKIREELREHDLGHGN